MWSPPQATSVTGPNPEVGAGVLAVILLGVGTALGLASLRNGRPRDLTAAMKEHGIVDSGDSLEMGIGAMTDARWKSFFDKSVSWGVYPADLDYTTGYTLEFVNKAVGVETKNKLEGN